MPMDEIIVLMRIKPDAQNGKFAIYQILKNQKYSSNLFNLNFNCPHYGHYTNPFIYNKLFNTLSVK